MKRAAGVQSVTMPLLIKINNCVPCSLYEPADLCRVRWRSGLPGLLVWISRNLSISLCHTWREESWLSGQRTDMTESPQQLLLQFKGRKGTTCPLSFSSLRTHYITFFSQMWKPWRVFKSTFKRNSVLKLCMGPLYNTFVHDFLHTKHCTSKLPLVVTSEVTGCLGFLHCIPQALEWSPGLLKC